MSCPRTHPSLSAGQPGMPATLGVQTCTSLPAAAYPLPTSAEVVRSGFEGKDGVFRDDAASGDRSLANICST